MPLYQRRPAPAHPAKSKGFLDKELQNIVRAIHGVRARTVTADTTVQATDYLILADPTSGDVNITFPDPRNAQDYEVTVKQINSAANDVRLIGTFDGSAAPVLGGQNNALTVQSDGTAWYITGAVA